MFDKLSVAVIDDFGVDKECNGHRTVSPGCSTCFEAETVDFGEESTGLERGDVETGRAGDGTARRVMCLVIGQLGLTDLGSPSRALRG